MRILLIIVKAFMRWHLKRQGMKISDDCRLIGWPDFGSEPYLISILGRHVTISGHVTFITHDGGTWIFRERPEFKDLIKYGRIVIKDNCFLGYGCVILPGVTIGPNSVVAAGAIVTKDVPSGTVCGGSPAKIIMTIDEYATKCLNDMPEYDKIKYHKDKRKELLKIFPYPN